jgi:phenylpyruvate tautomerase PptA (4-oxalocrotonate tautomerase family)
MPMVRVDWIKGPSEQIKADIARAIADLLSAKANIPTTATQVLFVDAEPTDWFLAHDSIAELRKRNSKT